MSENGSTSADRPAEDAFTVPLAHDWSATISRDGQWWIARLHPGPRPFGDVIGLSLPLWEALDERWATLVVVEMDEVEFLSSSLMGELVRLYKRIAKREGALRLCNLCDNCQSALRICGLDEVLMSAPNRDLAMHA